MLLTKVNNGYTALDEAMDRLMDFDSRLFSGRDKYYFPPVQIRADEEKAVVLVDLPGVERDSIEISFEKGQILKLKAERKEQEIAENEKVVLKESVSGQFQRTIQIPFHVDHNRTEAELKNGVLTITLYRSEEEKPKRIEIKSE